jgi:hypothetical protein
VIAPDAEGVLVSAQVYDPGADDEKDSVVIQASTIADENGFYTIFLHPGTYNIVAYKDGYNPECAKISLASNSSYIQDFTLNAASSGEITDTVSIDGGDEEQYATLSFRQLAQCDGEDIEVKSINLANGGTYTVSLPQGTYSVVASTFGYDNQQFGVEITDSDTELNIDF